MRALLSVADRDGISALARDLAGLGVELYATDGTREHLLADGIDALPVTALTDVPPLVGGLVKTFHPAVYAGILARRDRPEELAELAGHGIGLLDIVVVTVKPFAPQVGERRLPLEEALEMIDVGGTALLWRPRATSGRRGGQQPVCVRGRRGGDPRPWSVSAELRQRLAAEAFAVVAAHQRRSPRTSTRSRAIPSRPTCRSCWRR